MDYGPDPDRNGQAMAPPAPPRSRRPAAASSRKTKPRSVVWGMPGSAAASGLCSAVLPLESIAPKMAAIVPRRQGLDPAGLRFSAAAPQRTLRSRLTAEKHYLAESRLLPVARKQGLSQPHRSHRQTEATDAESLIVEVVEAMTTNESLFFRDKLPFDHFRDTMMPALLATRADAAAHSDLVCRRRDRAGALFLGDVPEGNGPRLVGWRIEIFATDISTRSWRRPRTASTASSRCSAGCRSQMLMKYFTQVGETWQVVPEIRAMVQYGRSTCCTISLSSAGSTWCSAGMC